MRTQKKTYGSDGHDGTSELSGHLQFLLLKLFKFKTFFQLQSQTETKLSEGLNMRLSGIFCLSVKENCDQSKNYLLLAQLLQ